MQEIHVRLISHLARISCPPIVGSRTIAINTSALLLTVVAKHVDRDAREYNERMHSFWLISCPR